MMALVAHDLRGPLTALVVTSDLIHRRRHELTADVKSAVEMLTDQVRGFHRLVLDLLEISQLDNGLTQLDIQRVDLHRFCHEMLHSRNETASVTIASGADFVLADPRLLRQIITNLLDNARAYAGGATRITVSRERTATWLAIEDAGPGLTGADQHHVFRRFERGSRASTGHTPGSGLGLALVTEHVQLHGGEVHYEPVDTGGARFVISIPDRNGRSRPVPVPVSVPVPVPVSVPTVPLT